MRATYMFVELEVPAEVYDLIARKLIEAEYAHCFEVGAPIYGDTGASDFGPIDMHGLALTRGPTQVTVLIDCPANDTSGHERKCPSGLAACEFNRKSLPESLTARYAAEDRAARGLPAPAAQRHDPSTGHDNRKDDDGEIASFAGNESRDGAPSMSGAKPLNMGSDLRFSAEGGSMLGTHAPASPASTGESADEFPGGHADNR